VSEAILVAAAKNGQRAAFDQLCEFSSRKILRTTYRITRNQEDAEDALQEAFLKAFVHLKDFDGRSNFSTWLTRIAINSALMILRKRRQGREISVDEFAERNEAGPVWEISDPNPGPETNYAQEEREKLLWGAIEELRPSLRKVIEFQLSRDCPMKKTAGMIGISVCAAKSRLFHAKTALRKSLRTKYAGVRAKRGTVLRFVRASRYSSTGVRTNSPMALRRKVG
jgi:RNA polymerase sigma factor (sigma-70 family)